jgi:predicted AAA+ superfamily ATPase
LPNIPLLAYKEEAIFKLYMHDIGLLSAKTGLDEKTYIFGNDALFTHYKGIIAEQFVFQELISIDNHLPVYYWADAKNLYEIEFIVQYDNKIIPIEVKSGKNIKSASLKYYAEMFNPQTSIRSSLIDYNVNQTSYDIPLYMIEIFKTLI